MAVFVTGGSSSGLETASVIPTTIPFSFFCWFKTSAINGDTIFNVGNSASHEYRDRYKLRLMTDGTVELMHAWSGGDAQYSTTNKYVAGAWQSLGFRITGTSARDVYLNGIKTSMGSYGGIPSGIDVTEFLKMTYSLGTNYHSNDIQVAYACLWDVQLTDEEFMVMHTRVLPSSIRSSSIVARWDFADGALGTDSVGSYSMTPDGTPTFSANPFTIDSLRPLKTEVSAWSPTLTGDSIDWIGSHDASLAGDTVVSSVTGKYGTSAFYLPGTYDFVRVTHSTDHDGGDEFSLSCWFYCNLAKSGYQGLISKSNSKADGYFLTLTNTDSTLSITAGVHSTSMTEKTDAGAYSLNTWHHVLMTYDGANINVYIDGTVVGSPTAKTGTVTTSTKNLSIGTLYDVGTNAFGGYIDDVRFFNTALTAVDARLLAMRRGYQRLLEDSLEAFWCPSLLDSPNDLSHNGNHGTYNGGMGTVVNTDAGGARAYNHDGADDYVSVGSKPDLDFTSSFTISAWVKMSSSPVHPGCAIVSKLSASPYNGYMLWVSGGTPRMYINTAARAIATTNIEDDTWHYIVVGWSGTEAWIVVDGIEEDRAAYSTPPSSASYQFHIGAYFNPTRIVTGLIDDIAIWSRSLTSAEVTSLYTGQRALDFLGLRKGLVARWCPSLTYVDSDSNCLEDISANSNDGTYDGTYAAGSTAADTGAGGTRAYTADGVDEYVIFGNDSSLQLTEGSMSCWFKTLDAGSGYRGLFVKQGAYGIFFVSNELALYDWGTSSTRLTGEFPNDGGWHHVAVVFESGVTNGTKVYLDGALVLTTTITVSYQTENVLVGYGNASTQFYTGLSDDAGSLWNRTLTEAEITQLYDTGTGRGLDYYAEASSTNLQNMQSMQYLTMGQL